MCVDYIKGLFNRDYIVWVKQCHKPCPNFTTDRWYKTIPKWVVRSCFTHINGYYVMGWTLQIPHRNGTSMYNSSNYGVNHHSYWYLEGLGRTNNITLRRS